MSSSVRSFLAIAVEESARSRIDAVVQVLGSRPNGDRVRWVRRANLHITLRFLGEVSSSVMPDLAVAVGDEVRGVATFECHLKDVRAFPNPKQPRVIAVALDAAGHLTELVEAVERGVVRVGVSPENRGFRAHLTLGRLRGHGYPSLHDDFDLADCTVPVDHVVLFRSDLRPDGAVYSEIEGIPLGS